MANKVGRPKKNAVKEPKELKEENGIYHPQSVIGMMEGTPEQILMFMLNNSGISKEKFKRMTGYTWESALNALESVSLVIKTLRLMGYKLVAIPVANYMLSDVESFQFILESDKMSLLDEIGEEVVNFKPMSMEELKSFGVEFADRIRTQNLIYEKMTDEDVIAEYGLLRSVEGWKFRPSPKKRKYFTGTEVRTYSKRQNAIREREYRLRGRPKAKETYKPIITMRESNETTDRVESDMFYGRKENEI